jgi:hypothetical protein
MAAMNNVIALLGTLVCVCILFAAWIGLTERGHSTDDWFRKRWGGSDSKSIKGDSDENDC